LRRRDLRPGDWQRERDLVEQALRQSGVDLEIRADTNIGGGRQVHDVVAGERISSESAQPPRELLHINHLRLILGLLMIHRNPRLRSAVPAPTARATAANNDVSCSAVSPTSVS
jgi:hypothetical protein